MVDKSRPCKSGVRQFDSEFSFILCMFCFGEVDEVLDSLQKSSFRDLSGSIVFTDNLERTITIIGHIIATIYLSISRRYCQRSREIICETDSVHGVIPTRAGICSRDILAETTAILIDEILFSSLGKYLYFGFFGIHLGDQIES